MTPADDLTTLPPEVREALLHWETTAFAYTADMRRVGNAMRDALLTALAQTQAERDEANARADQAHRDRYDALSVTSKDGLLSSEWILRTGQAERERDEAREAAKRMVDAINWACGAGDSDFGERVPEDAPRYWWRSTLAMKAGLIYNRDVARYEAQRVTETEEATDAT